LPAPPVCVANEDELSTTNILRRLTALEQSNTELQESNTKLQACNTELQERLIDLRTELQEGHDRLEATMQTTMEAVLGVCDIFNIYISFLSDFICRIASQSTRYETEFFLTWPRTDWPSFVAIWIGGIGRAVSTGTQSLPVPPLAFKPLATTTYLASGKPLVANPLLSEC
jgi:regulator of replication initiation timing